MRPTAIGGDAIVLPREHDGQSGHARHHEEDGDA